MAPAPTRLLELIETGTAQLAQGESLLPALGTAIALADALALRDERTWFEAEVAGYGERGGAVTTLGEVLGVSKASDIPGRLTKYRVTEGTVYLQFGDRTPEALPYAVFLPYSVSDLEAFADGRRLPYIVVPPEALPEFVQELLRKTNSPRVPMNVYLDPSRLSAALRGLRGELSRFFASARLVIPEARAGGDASVTTGAISATSVMIVTATGASQVTATQAQTFATKDALAIVRKDIAEIEDHVVGSRKDLDEVAANAPAIKEALITLVDRVEERLAGKEAVTGQELAAAAGEAARDLVMEKRLRPSVLSRVVANPIASGLATSALWDGLKAAWPLVEAAAKGLGIG